MARKRGVDFIKLRTLCMSMPSAVILCASSCSFASGIVTKTEIPRIALSGARNDIMATLLLYEYFPDVDGTIRVPIVVTNRSSDDLALDAARDTVAIAIGERTYRAALSSGKHGCPPEILAGTQGRCHVTIAIPEKEFLSHIARHHGTMPETTAVSMKGKYSISSLSLSIPLSPSREGATRVIGVRDTSDARDSAGDDVPWSNLRNLDLLNNNGYILLYRNEAVRFMASRGSEVILLLHEIAPDLGQAELRFRGKGGRIVLALDKPVRLIPEGTDTAVELVLKAMTETRIKLMVRVLPRDGGTDTPQSLKMILSMEFSRNTFNEVYCDGLRTHRGFSPAGHTARFEAFHEIQLKLGDAGAVRVSVNGKSYVFGKSGQIVCKRITWKKDPNKPRVYTIKIIDF